MLSLTAGNDALCRIRVVLRAAGCLTAQRLCNMPVGGFAELNTTPSTSGRRETLYVCTLIIALAKRLPWSNETAAKQCRAHLHKQKLLVTTKYNTATVGTSGHTTRGQHSNGGTILSKACCALSQARIDNRTCQHSMGSSGPPSPQLKHNLSPQIGHLTALCPCLRAAAC